MGQIKVDFWYYFDNDILLRWAALLVKRDDVLAAFI